MQPTYHSSPLQPQRYRADSQLLAQIAVLLPLEVLALALPLILGLIPHDSPYGLLALAWLAWFGLVKRVFTSRRAFWDELLYIVQASFCIAVAAGLLSEPLWSDFPLGVSAVFFVCLLLAVLAARALGRKLLSLAGLWSSPTVIFGAGDNAIEAYKALRGERWMGLKVVGFASFGQSLAAQVQAGQPGVFSWNDDPAHWVLLRDHYQCVIALEASQREERDHLIRQFAQHGIENVHVIPAMRGIPLYALETSHFQSHEVLMIHLRNNLGNPFYVCCKRLFDVTASLALIVLLSPALLALALLVMRDGGPAFFGHTRVGRNGKPFKCYKFRSMVVNAKEVLEELLAKDPVARAEWDKDFKLKNDPRVSRIGDFLRKTSLDELPQLWNVIRGDMSLVGPRPVIQAELERYGSDVIYYLEARPGVTGLWQVSGRSDVDYDTRVYLDAWYVKNWSLWTDISILFKTVKVVLGRDGAY